MHTLWHTAVDRSHDSICRSPLFSVRCAFAVDSSRRGHLHTAQVLPRQLHGHFLRAPRRDRTCGHPLCIRPRSAAPSSTRAGRRVRMHSLTHGTHARRPRRMLMGHEALLLATPTCTHGVSRGSRTSTCSSEAKCAHRAQTSASRAQWKRAQSAATAARPSVDNGLQSTTGWLHSGQMSEDVVSHSSMHSAWKRWRQGSRRTWSPAHSPQKSRGRRMKGACAQPITRLADACMHYAR